MKLTYRLISVLAVAVMLSIFVSGCNKSPSYRIGVSQCSQDDWRMKLNDEIYREIMLHDDAEVEIRSADDSNEKQIEDIRYFVENDFDIIIVSPNEAPALTPIIKEVYEQGIPVIIFDRNIKGDSYTARLGADDRAIGRSAAHYAFSLLGRSPKAIEICGRRGATPAEGRHDGFTEEFTSHGGKVLASEPANWNMECAEPLTDSLLREHPDVELIFAHNDRMAIGASMAVKSAGRDDIKIIGVDAAPTIGIQAVADSIIDATFLYPTEGQRIIRTAFAILKGEPYQRETILPSSSAVDLSNADILLVQNEALKDETEKMSILKEKVDTYWSRYSTQSNLIYACVAIILLLFGLVFLVLRAFWDNKKHRAMLQSQNRELEEQRDSLRALNEKLEEMTQSKLIFFTNVSHDLRTPLTLISEPVAQLANAGNLTPEQQGMIKIADKNVRILRRLINQILDFRKYETGKTSIALSEVDLGKAIGDWMESFQALARRRNLKLTGDIMSSPPAPTLAVDIEKIERVFFNLLSNAFKYTPDNGSIHVTYKVIGDKAQLSVADTGAGISERDLGNIFDRFFQVERVHPNGSGIGLSLTKAFVELHGGKIEVESTLHKGSVFTVTLPVTHVEVSADDSIPAISQADVEAELGVIEEQQEFADDKPLLLVIDDNKDIQQLITGLLSDRFNVITASDGSEGLRRAVKYVPDLIICDVMMPVMDGLECCRRLKAEVSTSHIPVLMLTACSMDEQRVQGYESGADGYLSKPFSGDVLKARCQSLVENRRRIHDLWKDQASAHTPPAPAAKENKPLPPAEIDNDFYRRFLEIFNAEMGNSELSVDSLASSMGLERTQFYRKIKALTNYSPVELIKNLRLKHAQHLLKTTDRSISEIAYDTGFSTPAYFTRCYRECYGETPSETRTRISK
ncbi:MAG: substrate-binding domain-containing protein [Duncaniella sp.]|nr:substrate-binding domain-containing protein [Duncaniella sp.]